MVTKKDFCKEMCSKVSLRKTGVGVDDLAIEDMERLRYSVFTGSVCPQHLRSLSIRKGQALADHPVNLAATPLETVKLGEGAWCHFS